MKIFNANIGLQKVIADTLIITGLSLIAFNEYLGDFIERNQPKIPTQRFSDDYIRDEIFSSNLPQIGATLACGGLLVLSLYNPKKEIQTYK